MVRCLRKRNYVVKIIKEKKTKRTRVAVLRYLQKKMKIMIKKDELWFGMVQQVS